MADDNKTPWLISEDRKTGILVVRDFEGLNDFKRRITEDVKEKIEARKARERTPGKSILNELVLY